jgi:hypothetical protein
MSRLNIKRRLLIIFILVALVQVAIAWIGLRGFGLSNDDLAEVYQERLVPVTSCIPASSS